MHNASQKLFDLTEENRLLKKELSDFKDMLLRLQSNQMQIMERLERFGKWNCDLEDEVEYLKGIPTNITVYKFDNTDYENDVANAPVELSRIQNLRQIPLNSIVPPPGVYFLYRGKELQYIGQSKNVYSRLNQHAEAGEYSFDRVFFMPCHLDMLDKIEKTLIQYFKPACNKQKYKDHADHEFVERVILNAIEA